MDGRKLLIDMSGVGKKWIKMKSLCNSSKRGGLQLPNLRLYHEAVAQSRIQDWIKLENEKLFNTEGHNMAFGWHAYLFYKKHRNDNFFKQHIIRNLLHSIWQK